MKLKRKYARRVLALLLSCPASMLLAMLLRFEDFALDEALLPLRLGLLAAGFVLFFLAMSQWKRHLSCPYCGEAAAYPWQRPGQKRYCPRCGKPFVFDGEREEEP